MTESGPARRRVTIVNERGLHARAAARFVALGEETGAEITVSAKGTAVSGRSIMGLMMLAAGQGTEIEIAATGPQAKAAVARLCAFVEAGFDED
jgi:phosphocarrier protein